jgi:hypothetical protein
VPSGRWEDGSPSPLVALKNSSVESIMARNGVGGSLRGEPMKAVLESFLLGERLRLPKQSAMNSMLPKRTVSLTVKPPHVKRSLSVETASGDE